MCFCVCVFKESLSVHTWIRLLVFNCCVPQPTSILSHLLFYWLAYRTNTWLTHTEKERRFVCIVAGQLSSVTFANLRYFARCLLFSSCYLINPFLCLGCKIKTFTQSTVTADWKIFIWFLTIGYFGAFSTWNDQNTKWRNLISSGKYTKEHCSGAPC